MLGAGAHAPCSEVCSTPISVCVCVQIKEGRWHGPSGKSHSVTQYHDVLGDNLGRWARIVVQVVVVISLFGTNVSQVVASSSDAYYLEHGLSKRCVCSCLVAVGR